MLLFCQLIMIIMLLLVYNVYDLDKECLWPAEVLSHKFYKDKNFNKVY